MKVYENLVEKPRKYAGITSVFVQPSSFVSTPGGNAFFFCLSSDEITSIQWSVNGTQLERLALRNVTAVQRLLDFAHISLDLNTSRIGCIATITDMTVNARNEGLLLIQGQLLA